jgi:hypothetical protein
MNTAFSGLGRVILALGLIAGVSVAWSPAVAGKKDRGNTIVIFNAGPAVLAFGGAKTPTTKADRAHCGQRAYSVSVGNPAFPDRATQWSRPCGW